MAINIDESYKTWNEKLSIHEFDIMVNVDHQMRFIEYQLQQPVILRGDQKMCPIDERNKTGTVYIRTFF